MTFVLLITRDYSEKAPDRITILVFLFVLDVPFHIHPQYVVCYYMASVLPCALILFMDQQCVSFNFHKVDYL